MYYKFFWISAFPVLMMLSNEALASILFIDPASPTVKQGDVFSLEVKGSGFTTVLDGGAFDLTFNNNVLNVTSVAVETSIWEFNPINGSINNTVGSVSDTEFNSFAHSNTNNFDIAKITFTAIGPGNSSIDIAGNPNNPFGSSGIEIHPIFVSGSVQVVQAVPIPAPFWLFGSAVIGFRTLSRSARFWLRSPWQA